MEMTLSEWMSAIGQVMLVVAVSFVALCAITSFVRFQLITENAVEAQELGAVEERDFRLKVMNRIAAARRVRQPLSLVLLDVPPDGATSAEIEKFVRPHIRAGDIAMSCGVSTVGFLLVCGAERVDAAIRRIAALAVAANIRGADDWRFGIAGYPDHGHKTSELYVRATSMIAEAKRTRLLMAGMSSPESVAEESKIPSDSVDPATGLLREEKMIGVMRRFIAQERRAEQPASLIYFDVDQPERLRDLHGPAPVDSMIKELAEILDAGIRESDVVARFGAYGFVVSMSSAPGSAALSAQRILNTVRKHAFRAGGGMKVSMCAGVAGYPDVIGTAVQYFIAAEAALRVAKSKGKNQCATYDRNMQIPSEGEKAVDHL